MAGQREKTSFVYCEKCGKKLLERKPNGVWRFRFGRIQGKDETIVDILFYGSLLFKCTRRTCGHVNKLNFFPGTPVEGDLKSSFMQGVE
jgi:hypothetical protein